MWLELDFWWWMLFSFCHIHSMVPFHCCMVPDIRWLLKCRCFHWFVAVLMFSYLLFVPFFLHSSLVLHIPSPTFSSSPSGSPMMQMLGHLMLSHKSSLSHLHFFSFFFLFAVLTGWVPLPSRSRLILYSASSSLLLNPSSVFFSAVIVSLSSVISKYLLHSYIFHFLLKFSLCLSILLPSSVSIFRTITF